MRKCTIYALLFALSFIGSLGLLSNNANAASIYDNAYQTVNNLEVKNNQSPIETHDISTQFLNMLNGNPPSPFTTPRYTTNTSGTTVFCSPEDEPCGFNTTVLQDLNTLGENDSWFISVYEPGGSFSPQPFICYRKNAQITLTWTETHVAAVNKGFCALINTNTTNDRYIITYNNQASRIIAAANGTTKNLFCANCIVNYPTGYEGESVKESYELPPEDPIAHKPNITWDVIDKQVTVYSDSQKNTATLQDYQIYWFISNTTFDMTQPSEAFAISGCTPPDSNNNFTVPVQFDYGIQAYYADENCNILSVDDNDEPLIDNMVVITIDGSTFSGSTEDHEAIIGEIPDNMILQAIRKFKPTDGGLTTLVFAPIEAVASLPDIVGTCTPITLPLMGQNVSLTCIRPTIQNSPMGGVYTVISVIVTGMVTWFVAWRTFGTIKNIQDPQDDKVEVLKL